MSFTSILVHSRYMYQYICAKKLWVQCYASFSVPSPILFIYFFYWLIGEGLKNCWNSGGSLIDKEWGFVFWGSCYKWGFFFFFFYSTIFSKNIDLNKKLKFFSYIVYRLFNVFFEKYDYTWPGNWRPQYIIYIYSFHHRGILGIIKPYTH